MPSGERGWSPINSAVGRLQLSCRRRASVAAGGGQRAEMCGAIGCAALREVLISHHQPAADEACWSGGAS
jgi:hypothetical protein